MSSVETSDCMSVAWGKILEGACHPRMSVAAWFPYHFVNAIQEPKKFKTRPREGLGIDSMGMFYITHGENTSAQAAWVEPDINIDNIDELVAAENAKSWSRETNHYGFPSRVYQQFSPVTAYPGEHCSFYRFSDSRLTLRDQLKRFLEPRTSCGVFMRLEHPDHQVQEDIQHSTSGGDSRTCRNKSGPVPIHRYPFVKEIRMDMWELENENTPFRHGAHVPLSIKLGRSRHRSETRQTEQTRGIQRCDAKQSATAGSDDHPAKPDVNQAYLWE